MNWLRKLFCRKSPSEKLLEEVKEEIDSWYDRYYIGGGQMEVSIYAWEKLRNKLYGEDSEDDTGNLSD